MLKKLLKYDLKWCLKVVTIYLGICLVLSVLGRLIDLLPDSIFFNILGGICKGAAISFGITGLVNAIIRSWVRMTNNMYKDESYLTHTLPIRIDKIFLSKIISTFILIIICMLTLLVSLIIMYLNDNTIDFLKTSLNILSNNLGLSVVGLIVLITVLLMVEVIFIILCGFIGIIYGYSHNNKKTTFMLLYGFGTYIVGQVVSIILIFFVSIFNKELNEILFNGGESIDISLLKGLVIVFILIFIIYSLIIYYFSNKKLLKGINID